MVKVKIDGRECEFSVSEPIVLSYNSDNLVDVASGRDGSAISFTMPLNSANGAIFGALGDVHPEVKFNSERHAMVIELDEIELFSGTAYLMRVVWSRGQRCVEVECRGGVIDWVKRAASTVFKKIELPYEDRLTESRFKASWQSDSPVKFFPVTRDSYAVEGSPGDVTGVRMIRSVDDYHPFIKVSALLEAIFAMEGYTVESATAVSEAFEDLYISGNYTTVGSSAAALGAMGFYAKRLESTTTTCCSSGSVSCSPYMSVASVGNIVDVESVAADAECYNYGGCLQLDNMALIYRPLTSICAGFEFFLHYTCDCTIESRTTLGGVNMYDTISDDVVKWEIINRHIDQRDNVAQGMAYNYVLFDLDEAYTYMLVGDDAAGDSVALSRWSRNRFEEVTITESVTNLSIKRRDGMTGLIDVYDGDWALYFGYVQEVTPTEIKVKFRTAARDCSPTSPIEFQFPLLRGGGPLSSFTLHEDSSLRPYFSSYPSYNTEITYEDVAHHSISALDFLSSLQHLFNLRFFTNVAAKRVTIESFDKFFGGQEWDWSEKVMRESDIEFEDLAHGVHRSVTYGYQQGDGAVNRQQQDEDDDSIFGRWSYEVDSYAAMSGAVTRLNPLLSASTNDEDGVLLVGNRDDVESVDSLGFSPRIAKYLGMIDVERENYQIPYVAFHSPQDDFTLCFEDRDGVEGLNRLYQSEVDLCGRAQLISLSLQLSAMEYSSLFEPTEQSPSLRSVFLFNLHGESFRTTLHSIESYNLESRVARCKFLTID